MGASVGQTPAVTRSDVVGVARVRVSVLSFNVSTGSKIRNGPCNGMIDYWFLLQSRRGCSYYTALVVLLTMRNAPFMRLVS